MKSDQNASDATCTSPAHDAVPGRERAGDSEGCALQTNAAARDLVHELVAHWFARREAEPTPVQVCWHDERGAARGRAQLALSLTRVTAEEAGGTNCTPRPASAGSSQAMARGGTASYSHELVATLAHDLNNLLTPIVAISIGLEQELSGVHASHDQARDLRIAAERAALFVQRTLSSLRLRAESAVHIGNVVREMRELLRVVAGARISLELDIGSRTGLALLDRNRLESGLLDLVSNARDAISDRGTITLRVSSVEVHAEQAELLGRAPGSYELVAIEDTGSGIHPDLQERIFEHHFTTKPEGKGSGLGLTHVRRFVEESGGAIAVNSAPGERTVFSLYFPRMRPEPTR